MRLVFLIVCVTAFYDGLGVDAIQTYYMDRQCGSTFYMNSIGLYAMRLKLTSRSYYYSKMNCSFFIKAAPGEKLMLYFKDEDILYSSFCSKDSLQVKDGETLSSPSVKGLPNLMCGYSMPSGVKRTTGNNLSLNFQSQTSMGHGFDMVITRYTNAPCFSWEYSCDNGRCVDHSVTCNGYNPCGDYSDCPLAAGAIAGIVIGGFFFVVIVITALVLVRRRRLRYRRGVTIQTTSNVAPPPTYGTTGVGYNQPVPQQYSYPTGTAPPPQQPTYQ